ncbi:hypothetical protein Acr_29g0005340 [Actinidia rufa]|uniref:ascorbate ferrireductase (transmembrane) n=1 Tax=Actinidia rufa TaxID=165716 RepID=A0A7J0HEB6_9ERIC|nr:hypothetical protein Acr_29g0005340 [Actinidia rufa]
MDIDRHRFRRSASRITVLAHALGVTTLSLLLVWLLHYREGINLDSDNASRVFNVHPFLMFFGFIFFAGEAAMAYKTVQAERKVQKFTHMLLNLIALVLGIVGIHAAFKYHNMINLKHMFSLHSWIGMGTLCFFILQWLFGFTMFMFPRSSNSSTRERGLLYHVCAGRALLYMAICAAETGLMEKASTLKLMDSRESHLVNSTGLTILLFGITVDLSIALARYI